jgi:hypothetical protein
MGTGLSPQKPQQRTALFGHFTEPLSYQSKEKVAMLGSSTFRVWFGATLLICAVSCAQALSAQENPWATVPFTGNK